MQKIASLLLRKNGIQFDKDEFLFQIQSHPSYPSLHSITGVLEHFNIDNIAARVPNTKDTLDQLPKSFIAEFKGENIQGLFFVEKQKKSCHLFDTSGKSKTVSIDEFHEAFSGIVLAVEKKDNTTKSITSKGFYTNVGFVVTIVSLLAVFLISTTSILSSIIFFMSAIGILISVSILQQEFGVKNSIGDAFCSVSSDKKDCHAVLTSKGASLSKGYKLSDLSLIYFIGYSISVFLLTIQELNLDLIFIISILSLPLTLYSIYYQAFIVKTWCLLCLSIVGILWLQAIVLFTFQSSLFSGSFEIIGVLSILIGFFSSFSIWSFLKPKYIEAVENKSHKIESFKFKRNYDLFSTLLKSNTPLKTVIQDKNEIVFGNPESKVEIVIITNPFCGHCKPVHTLVEDILERYSKHVKVIIRFNINLTDINSDIFVISSNLIHIHLTKGEEQSIMAMYEAYNKLSPQNWIKKWGDQTIDTDFYKTVLTNQKAWCTENNFNFTPAILINGYAFPKEYGRKDLLFFIEELHEEYNEELH